MSAPIQPSSITHVRRQFLRAGRDFDAHSAVFESVGQRLLDRLDLLAISPKRVLDLGCRSGYQLNTLQQRYPEAHIVGADPAPGTPAKPPRSWSKWLRRSPNNFDRLACDPHALPFADETFDLVVSNLLLPWCHAPHVVFNEVARILAPGGALLFTSVGPDTLKEYRAAWASIDSYLHCFGLLDMHDVGDILMAAGFAAPVLDRETLHVDYPSIHALQQELRFLGAANVASGRRMGLMAPSVRNALERAACASERFVVTLELVQGHGWKGELVPTGHNSNSEYVVSVDSLRGSWNRKIARQR